MMSAILPKSGYLGNVRLEIHSRRAAISPVAEEATHGTVSLQSQAKQNKLFFELFLLIMMKN